MATKTRRGIASAAAVLLAGVVLSGDVAAAEDSPSRKLGRGLAAMTCGFLELPGNMVMESRRRGPEYGMTLGFVKGLGGIVVRELVGVYEFVTAPFEVPSNYQPILAPEFPWDYFDEGRSIAEDRHPRTAPALGSRNVTAR